MWSCSQEACRSDKATTNVRSFSTLVMRHLHFHNDWAWERDSGKRLVVDGSLHVLHGRTGTVRDRKVAKRKVKRFELSTTTCRSLSW